MKSDHSKIKNKDKEISNYNLGEFDVNDFPEKDRNQPFYFHEYNRQDGEWIGIDEPICKIRIGKGVGFMFNVATVLSRKSGVLE